MTELLSLLKLAAGQLQLSSALGKWAQRISAAVQQLSVGWVGHAVCSANVTIAFPNVGPSPTYTGVAKPDCTVPGSPSLVFDVHSVIWKKVL